jgi:hypothetical protein
MKNFKLVTTIIVLCGFITFGYAAVFATGLQVQYGDGQDYYLKYIPAVTPITKGLTDDQILKRLVKRIEQLNSAGPDEETAVENTGTPAEDAAAGETEAGAPGSVSTTAPGLQTDAAATAVKPETSVGNPPDAFAINTDTANAAAHDTKQDEANPAEPDTTGVTPVINAESDVFDLPIFINITSPNGDSVEIVYKNTYSICGVRDDNAAPDEPIILFLTRYDAKTETYVELADINGDKKWVVGSNGVFTRSVLLEEGENNFAIAACKSSVVEAARTDGRIIEDAEIQVETFVILYRSQNVAEKISEVFKELTFANILKEIENK